MGAEADNMARFHTGAVRSKDANRVRYDLISPIALEEIAETCHEGAEKYGAHNWLKGMPVSDLLNHAIRHIYLFLSGDRSEPHLPHAAWGVMAAIHSHKMWPHLNTDLCGPGCSPPGGEAVATDEETMSMDELDELIRERVEEFLETEDGRALCREVALEDTLDGVYSGPLWDAENSRPKIDRNTIPVIDEFQRTGANPPVLYLSGPMTGIEDCNFPAFDRAAERLREIGYRVLSPADFGIDARLTWSQYLERDLLMLTNANVLVRLPGRDVSRGAQLEHSLAVALGKGVVDYTDLITPKKDKSDVILNFIDRKNTQS